MERLFAEIAVPDDLRPLLILFDDLLNIKNSDFQRQISEGELDHKCSTLIWLFLRYNQNYLDALLNELPKSQIQQTFNITGVVLPHTLIPPKQFRFKRTSDFRLLSISEEKKHYTVKFKISKSNLKNLNITEANLLTFLETKKMKASAISVERLVGPLICGILNEKYPFKREPTTKIYSKLMYGKDRFLNPSELEKKIKRYNQLINELPLALFLPFNK
ncbi:MAG: hypothetical protein ACXWQQ_02070 [Pseudobdellovibrio sp.]